MMILRKLFFVVLLLFSLTVPYIVRGADEEPEPPASQEDSLEDETTVEADEKPETVNTGVVSDSEPAAADDGKVDGYPKASTDADAVLVFTHPALGHRSSGAGVELPAGHLARLLISFTHKGGNTGDLTLDAVDGAFRYPQDYTYYLQNFTASKLARLVEPKRQASLAYSLNPAQQLAGRPFGLTIRVHYHDNEGKLYTHAVFNDTVMVIELDEGFDTEAFFLYVLIAAVVVILCLAVYHLVMTHGGRKLTKRVGRSTGPVEMGTANAADVDYDWIPREHLEIRTRKSPNQSPRQRKAKREGNHGQE